MIRFTPRLARLLYFVTPALMLWQLAHTQDHPKFGILSNAQMQQMLDAVETDIKEYYYDPGMHGVDLNKDFDGARRRIADAKSQNEGLLILAGAVAALKDSHTRFSPPVAPYRVDYGWLMQAIGDSACYVTGVRPDSDANAKGLKPGDQVVSINGITLVREDLGYVEYGYRVFPQSGLHLVVKSPNAPERPLVIMAKIIPGQPVVRRSDFMTWLRSNHKQVNPSRFYRVSDQLLLWKLHDLMVDPSDLDEPLNKVRPFPNVVLDLRGNPGGQERALEKLVGAFFDHDVKIGDRKQRMKSEPWIAKSRGKKSFDGKLIVLVDSRSSSAAEIFARIVQLEKRGVVLGDRSSGAVMEAKYYVHALPLDATNVTQYGVEVTIGDLIMGDGKSLERVGVTPDERITPSVSDLAAGRDPVLARAAEIAGAKMTPEGAGKVFPLEWPKEQMPEFE
jgi:carboxyl-terminal processing protease